MNLAALDGEQVAVESLAHGRAGFTIEKEGGSVTGQDLKKVNCTQSEIE